MLQVPLQVRGHQATALYPVPALAPYRLAPVAAEQGDHERHRLLRRRRRTWRAAVGADHAARRDGERHQRLVLGAAAGAFSQRGRVAGEGQRPEEVRVEDHAGIARRLAAPWGDHAAKVIGIVRDTRLVLFAVVAEIAGLHRVAEGPETADEQE